MQKLSDSFKPDNELSQPQGSSRLSLDRFLASLEEKKNYPPLEKPYTKWIETFGYKELVRQIKDLPSSSEHGVTGDQLGRSVSMATSQSLARVKINFQEQRQANPQLKDYESYVVGLDYGERSDKMAIAVVGIDQDDVKYLVHSFVPKEKNSLPAFLQLATMGVSYFNCVKVATGESTFTEQIAKVLSSSITDKKLEIRELPTEGNLKAAIDLRPLALMSRSQLYLPSNIDLVNKFLDYYSFLLNLTKQKNPVNESSVLQAYINAIAIS